MMEWIVQKQIAVEAETPEEAVQKINEGKTISFNVSLRPQAQRPQVMSIPSVSTNLKSG
jgi:hypothetical protein